jgi:hypothetical protein
MVFRSRPSVYEVSTELARKERMKISTQAGK